MPDAMDRSMRQRSIAEFCYRFNGSQPSTAAHVNRLDTSTAAPSSMLGPAPQVCYSLDDDSPHSIPSSPTASLYNPNTGLQLCTSAREVTASLWLMLEPEDRKALQSISYFVNSDLRWYLKELQPSKHRQCTAPKQRRAR